MFQPQNSFGAALTAPQANNQQVGYGAQLMRSYNPMPPGMVSGGQYNPNNPGIQMIRGNPVMRRPQWMMPPQTGGQMLPPVG